MSTLQEKLDKLIYFVCEAPLSPEEVLVRVQGLFPQYDPDNTLYEAKINELFLDIYEVNRGLGLSVDECAAQLDISGNLLLRLLHGEGLSLQTFVKLARAERQAISAFKRTHLRNIDNYAATDEKNGWRASIALLEKVLPAQYGMQLTMFEDASVRQVDPDMTLAASADLYVQELNKFKQVE